MGSELDLKFACGQGQTSVYASRDPSNFGVGEQSDAYLVARLPFCAPELVQLSDGRVLVVALAPGLNGFRVAELAFGKQDAAVTVKSDDDNAEQSDDAPLVNLRLAFSVGCSASRGRMQAYRDFFAAMPGLRAITNVEVIPFAVNSE